MELFGTRGFKKTLANFKKRGIILMYHRVAKPDSDPWRLSVSPSNFEEHMRVIRNHGQPIQMQELGNGLRRYSFGRKEVVVTFDDSYADNFLKAKPILEQYEIPATFFVVTGAIDSQEEFWWDKLEQIILSPKTLPESFEMDISGTKYHWPVNPTGDSRFVNETPSNGVMVSRAQLYYALWQVLGNLSFPEKKDYLLQIASWAGHISAPRTGNLPMSSEELFSLASSSLFEIGSHTVCHPMLSRLTRDKQQEEISRSKQYLEDMLSRNIASFSYPHGDYSDTTVELVKALGFRCACTLSPTPVVRGSDVYRLPRFKVLNWSGKEFEYNLKNWLYY